MKSDDRYLSWERLQALMARGAPALIRVQGDPTADFFVDPGSNRIGLRLRVADPADSPMLPESITMTPVVVDDVHHLEIAATDPRVHATFYVFLQRVCDAVQLDRIGVHEALVRTIREWHLLLAPADVLGPEDQVGLYGELWFLLSLSSVRGLRVAHTAWTGPSGGAHDFRLGNLEFEVKTTLRERRLHKINGLTQLTASVGCVLHILSLQFTDAGQGAGMSLSALVAVVRSELKDELELGRAFEDALSARGYSDVHAASYQAPWKLRTLPALIAADQPQLPRLGIASGATSEAAMRLREVRYVIDCEGLGVLQGSAEFGQVLPIPL